jgi:hypothetical protein
MTKKIISALVLAAIAGSVASPVFAREVRHQNGYATQQEDFSARANGGGSTGYNEKLLEY